jgi:cysteine-rich repeat protein
MIRLLPLVLLSACLGLPDDLDTERNHPNDPGKEAEACGNGIQNTPGEGKVGGEECDDGNDIDDDACRNDCTKAYCGDGVLRTDANQEFCDDGNSINEDGCTEDCVLARCGDGIVRTDKQPGEEGYEACDPGAEGPDDQCTAECTLPGRCGDGVVNPGEACDCGDAENCIGCDHCALVPCIDNERCDDPGAHCLRVPNGEAGWGNYCLAPAPDTPPSEEILAEHGAAYLSCVNEITLRPNDPNRMTPCAEDNDCEDGDGGICRPVWPDRDRGLCTVEDANTGIKLLGFNVRVPGHPDGVRCRAMGCAADPNKNFDSVGQTQPLATRSSCTWMRPDDNREEAVLPLCLSQSSGTEMDDGHQNVCVFRDCKPTSAMWGNDHCAKNHGDVGATCSAPGRCVYSCEDEPCESAPIFPLISRNPRRLTGLGMCTEACGIYGAECTEEQTDFGVFSLACNWCDGENDSCAEDLGCTATDEAGLADTRTDFRCLSPCFENSDCSAQAPNCIDGHCSNSCLWWQDSDDCGAGQICAWGMCRPEPRPCSGSDDCEVGGTCTRITFSPEDPLEICLPDQCLVTRDCPALSVCTSGRCTGQLCTGFEPDECGEGYSCGLSLHQGCFVGSCTGDGPCNDDTGQCIAGRCLAGQSPDGPVCDGNVFYSGLCTADGQDEQDGITLDISELEVGRSAAFASDSVLARFDRPNDVDTFTILLPNVANDEIQHFFRVRLFTRGTLPTFCETDFFVDGIRQEDHEWSGPQRNCLIVFTPTPGQTEVTLTVRTDSQPPAQRIYDPGNYLVMAIFEGPGGDEPPRCGNGQVEVGEACDSLSEHQDQLFCTSDCMCHPSTDFAPHHGVNTLEDGDDVPAWNEESDSPFSSEGPFYSWLQLSCAGALDGTDGASVELLDTTGDAIVFGISGDAPIGLPEGVVGWCAIETVGGGGRYWGTTDHEDRFCRVTLPAVTGDNDPQRTVRLSVGTQLAPGEHLTWMSSAIDYFLYRE